MPKSFRLPMCRDFAEPLHTGIFHGHVRVEAFGDGARDERGALLLQQLDQPFLLRHKRSNLRRLPVEEGCNCILLFRSWDRYSYIPDCVCIEV
jgi:hypothetical protein